MKLNLGCSTDLRSNWTNVDIHLGKEQDPVKFPFQQADLSLPWPWPDSSVDEIYAADIFEHIGDCSHQWRQICERCWGALDGRWPPGRRGGASGCALCGSMPCVCAKRHWSGRIHVMNESWRVLKPGGLLTMECPDAAKGAGQWQDPTHTTPWTPNGLQYFADGSPAHKRFAAAHGTTARFKVLAVSERKYTETAGGVTSVVLCEVWKFRAILEAVKS
jgi:hypothetical protein